MSTTIPSVYDRVARFLMKSEPSHFCAWLLGKGPRFRDWLDTTPLETPQSPNRVADGVAHIVDPSDDGRPWAVIFEMKLSPEIDACGQVLSYAGAVFNSFKPDPLPGSRYCVTSMIVNLTGQQDLSFDKTLGERRLRNYAIPEIENLASRDADDTLSKIERGELGLSILPWIALMQGGERDDVIVRWKHYLAERETSHRRRADYAVCVLALAEAAKRSEKWKKSLEGWNMIESEIANEWIRMGELKGEKQGKELGLKEGKELGLKEGLLKQIQLLQRLLDLPLSTEDVLHTHTFAQLQQLAQELEARLKK